MLPLILLPSVTRIQSQNTEDIDTFQNAIQQQNTKMSQEQLRRRSPLSMASAEVSNKPDVTATPDGVAASVAAAARLNENVK
ncbi:hypothetical protein GLYMA_20G147500v4 [Glycine max]|uniref:SMP domain-containing protein n=1 Tax=Glycine max TaxID=3847 RepID=K7N3I3_SOYBN|nr:hypothetical protein GYH30_055891 [Glycine max]KRG91318.1 hypothetical protein GLYMA_20G147500v4 [Glycine max]